MCSSYLYLVLESTLCGFVAGKNHAAPRISQVYVLGNGKLLGVMQLILFQAYALAWILDLIMPLVLVTVIIMIVYPPSRAFLFPPAPLALVDGSTGGVKKPAAGVLGSHDSATGAPEHYKGEAVEAEASHFVNGIGHIALSSVAGKHPMNEPKAEDGSPSDTVPDPTALVGGAANSTLR